MVKNEIYFCQDIQTDSKVVNPEEGGRENTSSSSESCQLANVTTLEFSTARIIPAEEGSTKSSVEKHELGTTSRSNRTHLETCYNSNLVRKSFVIKFPMRQG